MLKNVPGLLSPELLKVLCEMGHGDRIVFADGNFPAASIAKNSQLIRMDGHGIKEILEAVLKVFPLDTYVDQPVMLMEKVPGDMVETPIWNEIAEVVQNEEGMNRTAIGFYERFEFYKQAENCFAVVATGESAQYANVILQKGVIKQ